MNRELLEQISASTILYKGCVIPKSTLSDDEYKQELIIGLTNLIERNKEIISHTKNKKSGKYISSKGIVEHFTSVLNELQ